MKEEHLVLVVTRTRLRSGQGRVWNVQRAMIQRRKLHPLFGESATFCRDLGTLR